MEQPTQSPKRTVLIIEDNFDFAKIYKDLLGDRGFEVLYAENGETGLALAKEQGPDVILLDLILPKMHGYEVLKNLRSSDATKNIPVIVFSVMGDQADMKKAFDLGADDFSTKGFARPTEIFTKIDKVILERQAKK